MRAKEFANTIGSKKKDLIIALLLIISTSLVYYQVGSHEFINFDDPDYVSENNHVKEGLSMESVKWAFDFPEKQYWAPLSFVSHMIDIEMFGMNAGLHHLMNLFYHILNCLLLYLVMRLMTGAYWRSAFVAGLLALHPVNVDSVAWMAERKNLLSTTFWLLTMVVYLYYSRKPDIKKYALLLGTFILGLMAKQMLVTLPFVLLLLDFWPLGRIKMVWNESREETRGTVRSFLISGTPFVRLVMEKLPMLVLSLAAIVISFMSVKDSSTVITTQFVPMSLRIENAIVSYVHYLWKLFFPHNLTFYYPYPDVIPAWQVIGSAALLILTTAFVLRLFFRAPYLTVGWMWFLGTIVPVSGIIQGGLWPAIAERWAYVPFIGIFIMISWGLQDLLENRIVRHELFIVPATLVLVVLALLAWRQASVWKDDMTLFTYAIRINPRNFVAHVNLGDAYVKANRSQDAIPHFIEALRLNEGDIIALRYLGSLYKKNKELDKAIQCYLQILKHEPESASLHYDLGELYADKGLLDKANQEFLTVIKLNPRDAGAYYNLGVIAAKNGQKEVGINYLTSALRIKPSDVDSRLALGVVLLNEGKAGEAIGHIKEVLRMKPDSKEARSCLSAAMSYRSNGVSPRGNEQMALAAESGLLYEAAVVFSSRGEYAQAIEALNRMLYLQPGNPDIYYNIACIYAKQNKTRESLEWLKSAINKGFKNWELIASDKDLDSIRNSEEYKKIMALKKT